MFSESPHVSIISSGTLLAKPCGRCISDEEAIRGKRENGRSAGRYAAGHCDEVSQHRSRTEQPPRRQNHDLFRGMGADVGFLPAKSCWVPAKSAHWNGALEGLPQSRIRHVGFNCPWNKMRILAPWLSAWHALPLPLSRDNIR